MASAAMVNGNKLLRKEQRPPPIGGKAKEGKAKGKARWSDKAGKGGKGGKRHYPGAQTQLRMVPPAHARTLQFAPAVLPPPEPKVEMNVATTSKSNIC